MAVCGGQYRHRWFHLSSHRFLHSVLRAGNRARLEGSRAPGHVVRVRINDLSPSPAPHHRARNHLHGITYLHAQKLLLWSLLGCILTCSRFPVSSSSFETFAVSIFSVEYLIRFICCPNRRTFVIAPLNLVDLLAIVPCACHVPSPVTTPISPVLGPAWRTPARLGSARLVPNHLLRSRRSTGFYLRSCRRRL